MVWTDGGANEIMLINLKRTFGRKNVMGHCKLEGTFLMGKGAWRDLGMDEHSSQK